MTVWHPGPSGERYYRSVSAPFIWDAAAVGDWLVVIFTVGALLWLIIP